MTRPRGAIVGVVWSLLGYAAITLTIIVLVLLVGLMGYAGWVR